MRTFRKGGVHPPGNKTTAGKPIVRMALPRKAVVALAQNIGATPVEIVKKGEKVSRGQLVADSGAFMSAPLHAPISGTVTGIEDIKDAAGVARRSIIIEAEEDEHARDAAGEYVRLETQGAGIAEIVRNAGIVGLGGAAFPSHVKLSPGKDVSIDTLIINGAECEPNLTCDHALMLSSAREIVRGAQLMMDCCGAGRVVIAIEDNKPDAIEELRKIAAPPVEVCVLRTKYPQGGEKQLIQAVTGRSVASGCLPASVGVVVQNVATAYAVCQAVDEGMPLMQRVVTVAGEGISRPGNYLVGIGTRIGSIIDFCGGLKETVGKVIVGGPMMGRAAVNLDAPLTKGMSGIILLSRQESRRREVQPCIRCGECVDVCPMGLEPYLLATLSRLGDTGEAMRLGVSDCLECGCCSYVCPSGRPIADYMRLGRARAAAARRAALKSEMKKGS